MSSQNPRFLTIEITANSAAPELLEGLEAWRRLGLLSDAQIKQLSRQYLSCPLPLVTPVATVPPVAQNRSESSKSGDFYFPVPPETSATRSERESVSPTQQPSRVTRILQSLMAELSVRWLLFLGVFMVVVSSGLLAATQWEKFPAFGQYGVLLAYTLIFWVVSFWAGKQSNLQLTAQTLQAVTLCLVPVNFWAMDGFRLWGNVWEWLTVAIASVTLTTITVLILKTQRYHPDYLGIINYLGLSYLLWGWGFKGYPLVAVYVGIVGTSLATFYSYSKLPQSESSESPVISSRRATTAIIYGIAVLLIRAILLTKPPVEIAELGLAIGICGWLLAWLSHQRANPLTSNPPFSQVNWELIGGVLLVGGWLVSVDKFPGQALAVSGIGLWFFNDRLKRFWLKADLTAFLLVGLPAIWLFWRVIPFNVQQTLIVSATKITNSQDYPFALLGVVLFPYLIFMMGVTDWLYRREKGELVEVGEALSLIFGLILTSIALVSPLLRSINLLASTITLAVVTQRRSRLTLVYLTHVFALLTITSAIYYFWPNLDVNVWITVFQGLMLAELAFSITNLPNAPLQLWQRSSGDLGLCLAALSYAICLNNVTSNSTVGLLWLSTPVALTGVAAKTEIPRRRLAAWLSLSANIMAPILFFSVTEARLFSLGLATILMFVNTRYLQYLIAAAITIGFGLSFFAELLWDGVLGFPKYSISYWFIAWAIMLNILWLVRSWLNRKNTDLARIYSKAIDGWCLAICSFQLFLLTCHSFIIYAGFFQPSVEVLIAIVLTFGAIVYRSWRQYNNLTIYALAWSLELLTAEILGFVGRSAINLSIANIAFGLLSQLLGDWWRRRFRVANFPVSLNIIPLVYAMLGGVLRWGSFTSWTGLNSMAISLIAVAVGRRKQEFKPLLYLGLFGVSASAYELLFYQFTLSSSGGIGDGLIAMAALGTTIMYVYRLLFPWLLQYLQITATELKLVAHLHWIWSSCLLILTMLNPIQNGQFVGLGVGLFLVRYAILQGRNNPNLKMAETWVYLGLLQAAGIGFYLQYTPAAMLFSDSLKPFQAAIACVVAYFLYILPWSNWGWPKRPWLLAAIVCPLVIVLQTQTVIHPLTLLIVAGFYIVIAWLNRQVRFTYISAVLIDTMLWRLFTSFRLTSSLWYVIPLGLSLLYIAQIDPTLKLPEQRQNRHYLRCLGVGVICLVSLVTEQSTGLASGILSIVAIFAGLALRTRSFLYIGTVVFLINAFNQLVILNFRYAFLKWLIGLLVGITFIWVAANFETRREQLTSLIRNWLTELQNWE